MMHKARDERFAEIIVLEQDHKTWTPVLAKDHAQKNKLDRVGETKKGHHTLRTPARRTKALLALEE